MASDLVDLRSDTVTRPTPEMRKAMAASEVGDDDYGEDPTVNHLEAMYAERVGKPAAVLVPSGTMANLIAVRVLATYGSVVVAGRQQHILAFEHVAASPDPFIRFHPLSDDQGTIDAADIISARTAASGDEPGASLVCIEDTHMAAGGVPWPLQSLHDIRQAAGELPVHMDGARLFNAEVATGVDAAERASCVTTVMTCLSKGLCAPAGSLLAGPADVIGAARFERKRLGGGMRQAGVLAAPGIVALRYMVDRLADDHGRARRLAEAIAELWPGSGCDPEAVCTNIVVFRPPSVEKLLDHLSSEGILAWPMSAETVRFVTHRDVDDNGIERTVRALGSVP